jgi:hypothetical protein
VAEHVLYGVKNSSVHDTATALGSHLGLSFSERDSDYFGVYMLASRGSTKVKVVAQPDPAGDPLEDDFEDYATLVYVDADGDVPVLDDVSIGEESVLRLRG